MGAVRAQRPLAFSRKSLSRNGKQVARVQGLPRIMQKENPEGITFGFWRKERVRFSLHDAARSGAALACHRQPIHYRAASNPGIIENKKKNPKEQSFGFLAEREGFEPSVPL